MVSLNSLAVLLNYSTTTSQAISAHIHLTIGSSLNLSVCRCCCCDYLNLGVFKLNLILLGCPGIIAAPLYQWNTWHIASWPVTMIKWFCGHNNFIVANFVFLNIMLSLVLNFECSVDLLLLIEDFFQYITLCKFHYMSFLFPFKFFTFFIC
jgi:hypothetical protein